MKDCRKPPLTSWGGYHNCSSWMGYNYCCNSYRCLGRMLKSTMDPGIEISRNCCPWLLWPSGMYCTPYSSNSICRCHWFNCTDKPCCWRLLQVGNNCSWLHRHGKWTHHMASEQDTCARLNSTDTRRINWKTTGCHLCRAYSLDCSLPSLPTLTDASRDACCYCICWRNPNGGKQESHHRWSQSKGARSPHGGYHYESYLLACYCTVLYLYLDLHTIE